MKSVTFPDDIKSENKDTRLDDTTDDQDSFHSDESKIVGIGTLAPSSVNKVQEIRHDH